MIEPLIAGRIQTFPKKDKFHYFSSDLLPFPNFFPDCPRSWTPSTYPNVWSLQKEWW